MPTRKLRATPPSTTLRPTKTLPELPLKDFRRWCRVIRKLCPTKDPVSIRRVDLPLDRIGDCSWIDGVWHIRISKWIDRAATAETIVHEWTHALRDESAEPFEADHDATYWQIYGKVWCAFYGES